MSRHSELTRHVHAFFNCRPFHMTNVDTNGTVVKSNLDKCTLHPKWKADSATCAGYPIQTHTATAARPCCISILRCPAQLWPHNHTKCCFKAHESNHNRAARGCSDPRWTRFGSSRLVSPADRVSAAKEEQLSRVGQTIAIYKLEVPRRRGTAQRAARDMHTHRAQLDSMAIHAEIRPPEAGISQHVQLSLSGITTIISGMYGDREIKNLVHQKCVLHSSTASTQKILSFRLFCLGMMV